MAFKGSFHLSQIIRDINQDNSQSEEQFKLQKQRETTEINEHQNFIMNNFSKDDPLYQKTKMKQERFYAAHKDTAYVHDDEPQ